MKKKVLSIGLIILGAMFLVLAANQFNQYFTADASTSMAIAKLNEFSSDPALLTQLGMTQTDVDTTKQYALATMASYLATALIELIIGLVLFIGGYLLAPKELH